MSRTQPSIPLSTPFTGGADTDERRYTGVGVAPGISIGPANRFTKRTFETSAETVDRQQVNGEVRQFRQALDRAARDLDKIASVAREKLGDDSAAIFEAQSMMLGDDAIHQTIIEYIEKEHYSAEHAVRTTFSAHRRRLESSESEYFRERANDLLDLQNRLIRHLHKGEILSRIEPETIVVAQDLTAADIILFSRRNILGCATDYGGATSHVSIMARGLGVPAVVSLGDVSDTVETGDQIIIDGFRGEVIVRPKDTTLAHYQRLQTRYQRLLQDQERIIPLASETMDGTEIVLRANLELPEELPLLERYNADGVGLFRTEIWFMVKGRLDFPEDDLYGLYRTVVEAVRPASTTFRMLDLGGDKMLPMAHREHNPFLGWRGIRVLLDRPEVLRVQLRALLRAGAHGPINLLVPMVTHLDEVHSVKALVQDVQQNLAQEGIDHAQDVPLGLMVEVPSVALMAERFAQDVDFLSIGTNDLTQYVLAVDRGNDLVADLYHELHPAVLQLIGRTAKAGQKAGIPVSLCGQLASNPRAIPVLVGLGLRELSASPAYLPEVKRVIRALDLNEAQALAQKALQMANAPEVEAMLDRWLQDHACGFHTLFNDSNGQSK